MGRAQQGLIQVAATVFNVQDDVEILPVGQFAAAALLCPVD